jgi:hypothetical protein
MRDSFAIVYSSKSDDELLTLAANPDSLVEEANRALDAEMERRNLEKPSSLSEECSRVTQSEWRWASRGVLHIASAVAVFLTSTLMGITFVGAFSYANRYRRLTSQNFWVLAVLFTIIIALSLVGSGLLVAAAIKSSRHVEH